MARTNRPRIHRTQPVHEPCLISPGSIHRGRRWNPFCAPFGTSSWSLAGKKPSLAPFGLLPKPLHPRHSTSIRSPASHPRRWPFLLIARRCFQRRGLRRAWSLRRSGLAEWSLPAHRVELTWSGGGDVRHAAAVRLAGPPGRPGEERPAAPAEHPGPGSALGGEEGRAGEIPAQRGGGAERAGAGAARGRDGVHGVRLVELRHLRHRGQVRFLPILPALIGILPAARAGEDGRGGRASHGGCLRAER